MKLQLAIGFFMVLFLSINGYGQDMSTVTNSTDEQPPNIYISEMEDSSVQDMPPVSTMEGEQPPNILGIEDSPISQDADNSITMPMVLNKNAAKCYKLGNRSLKRGVKEMMQTKDSLDNLFMKEDIGIVDICECFKGKDIVSFSEFFDELYKKYKLIELRKAKAAIIGIGYPELKKAISLFSEAIKHDPVFVDAFLGRAMAYLEIGMNEEAMIDLEKAMKIGFEKIIAMDVFNEEFKNLCLKITSLYLDKINLVDEDQQSNLIKTAEDVMDKFIDVRTIAAKELILAEHMEEKKVMISERYFIDKFIKARCYMSRGYKTNAEAEFNKVYEELKSELDIYPTAKEQIDSLGYSIKNMAALATLRFEFEEDFKVLKPYVNIELLKEEQKPAAMDDINVYLSDSKYEIRFKKDAIRQKISQGKFLIPGGRYTCNIQLFGLEILEKDKIPFAIEETTYYTNIFPAMQLKVVSRKGGKLSTLILSQDKYKINPDGTLYKGVKACSLEEGLCEVCMSISNKLNFMGGKEYVIRIKKAYDWKPYIPIEIARRITKRAVLPGIGVLFLLLR
ncbi:MAG: hypothetical protein QME49_02015 [bacterium]|nr:hypothetical protein [bacterium]